MSISPAVSPPAAHPGRRWLRRGCLYSPLVVVIGLLLLHPFSRQWVFGPKIDGMPLCYWQEQLRIHADRQAYNESLATRVAIWLGVAQPAYAVAFPTDPDCARVALSLVDDRNPKVRARMAWMLDHSPEAQKALLQLLNDSNPIVRSAGAQKFAAVAQQPIGSREMARLTEMLDDSDSDCRISAACAVARHAKGMSPRAEAVLRAGLKDPAVRTRMDALAGLCRHAKEMPGSFAHVLDCIQNDGSVVVRNTGAAQVAGFGRVAVPLLVRLLDDTNEIVRQNACNSLGALGDDAREALPALVRRSGDPVTSVRQAAGAALTKIDPEQYPPQPEEPEP
jgi:hypothetical protein